MSSKKQKKQQVAKPVLEAEEEEAPAAQPREEERLFLVEEAPADLVLPELPKRRTGANWGKSTGMLSAYQKADKEDVIAKMVRSRQIAFRTFPAAQIKRVYSKAGVRQVSDETVTKTREINVIMGKALVQAAINILKSKKPTKGKDGRPKLRKIIKLKHIALAANETCGISILGEVPEDRRRRTKKAKTEEAAKEEAGSTSVDPKDKEMTEAAPGVESQ